jgi:GNAT superfamily N-acetyltransferase
MGERAFAIRRLRPGDVERLRELMAAAKGHWGYDPDWVREWTDAPGNFTVEEEPGAEVAVAELDGRTVGWAQWMPRGEVAWLEDLWIEPTFIGTGIGRALFDWYRERVQALGFRRLEWEAEPHAAGFYEKLGARYLREGDRLELGRTLPVMGIDLLS